MPVDHIISDESIFVDSQIETGTSWPIRLREALRNSRCLISVWSPQYFQSNWCLAELHSMLQREQILGLRNGQNWSGLIYPVVFKSAQLLPPEYHYIQYKDLSRWGIDEPSFRDSPEFLNLVIKIQDICK